MWLSCRVYARHHHENNRFPYHSSPSLPLSLFPLIITYSVKINESFELRKKKENSVKIPGFLVLKRARNSIRTKTLKPHTIAF